MQYGVWKAFECYNFSFDICSIEGLYVRVMNSQHCNTYNLAKLKKHWESFLVKLIISPPPFLKSTITCLKSKCKEDNKKKKKKKKPHLFRWLFVLEYSQNIFIIFYWKKKSNSKKCYNIHHYVNG